MINVSRPFIPPLTEYQELLEGIWERGWLTNNGPLVNELELKLKEFLSVNHLLFLSNGTIALQIAIKALDLKGDIITTPFSYVATTSSIVWEGCSPVFVDIDPNTLNIDPTKIEEAITDNTSAILATHVFGNPCDIDRISAIAEKHRLKVIYDGAHCFGTKYKDKSVFSYGDVTTTSFHATKLYHTIEGGAVFTNQADLLKRMAFMRNFGHNGPVEFAEVGINGKNSEVHAAMGLVNLNYVTTILEKRKQLCKRYDEKLIGLRIAKQKINCKDDEFNFSYYPIVFETKEQLLSTVELLNANWIYPRRYFYPSLNTISYTNRQSLSISESVSSRILCLPLYHTLTVEEIDFICRLLLAQNN
jgi:dTDP-4-amino-4,6-dideoxygalactose transaminase